MTNQLTELHTYEVNTYQYDKDTGEVGDSIDTHYLLMLEGLPMTLDNILLLVKADLANTYIEVYEARSATLTLIVGKNKQVIVDEVEATYDGYYSSAVLTAYLNNNKQQTTFE